MDFLSQVVDFVTTNLLFWVDSSFISNVVVGIITAVIGAKFALSLYRKQVKADRKKDKRIKNEKREQTLRYFNSTINSAFKKSYSQLNYVVEFIEKLGGNKNELPLISKVPMWELNRIVDSSMIETYFHSYCNSFEDKVELNVLIDEFRKCIAGIDFINDQTVQLIEMLERKMELERNRFLAYVELVSSSMDVAVKKVNDATKTKKANEFTVFLKEMVESYNDVQLNVHEYQTLFVEKTIRETKANFMLIEEAREYCTNLNKACTIYSHNIKHNERTLAELNDVKINYKEAVRNILPVIIRLNGKYNIELEMNKYSLLQEDSK